MTYVVWWEKVISAVHSDNRNRKSENCDRKIQKYEGTISKPGTELGPLSFLQRDEH
jgi:hypothetical protein